MGGRRITWRARAAVALVAALGTGTASAVFVNPDGLGQVLLFPYYSARTVGGSANATLITVSNLTTQVKALHVSFFEGKAGKEVLGFNLFLAPTETWTALIGRSAVGGAQLSTESTACTRPDVADGTAIPFRNFAYAGDGLGDGIDRTLEGYAQVIEEATYPETSQTAIAATPVDGARTCAVTDNAAIAEALPPAGRLMGHAEITNPLQGSAFTADPTALDAFSATPIYFAPGTVLPDLSMVNPPVAAWSSSTGAIVAGGFSQNVDAVSAVLMHESVLNGYTNAAATASATDWVFTFPTKPFYVSGSLALPPFQRSLSTLGSCDDLGIFVPGVAVVPPSPGTPALVPSFCWASTVMSFTSGGVLGSANAVNFAVPTNLSDKWARVTFAQTGVPAGVHRVSASSATVISPPAAPSTGIPVTLTGLPVIGFAARRSDFGVLSTSDGPVRSILTTVAPHAYVDTVLTGQ